MGIAFAVYGSELNVVLGYLSVLMTQASSDNL